MAFRKSCSSLVVILRSIKETWINEDSNLVGEVLALKEPSHQGYALGNKLLSSLIYQKGMQSTFL